MANTYNIDCTKNHMEDICSELLLFSNYILLIYFFLTNSPYLSL